MPPNSEMPLFDSTNDGVMFIKTTDGAGFPTITVVDCKRRDGQREQSSTDELIEQVVVSWPQTWQLLNKATQNK